MPIRVLVVDDQAIARAGIRTVLNAAPDLEVVGEAADGAEAARVVASSRPDVVLMDVRMPRCDGIEGTRRIAALGLPVRVLVVTTFALDQYVYDALAAGASGFVLKDVEPSDLQGAVRTVHAGHALLAPEVTRGVIDAFVLPAVAAAAARDPRSDELTQRETEVLAELAHGLSNAEIAVALHLAQSTVKSHVSSLLAKLDLRDRVQLVVFAYQQGLVARRRERA